ncbi:MAG: leucyl/phenylalanyl-tRNA--protein transferase [Defluviitaleaceae bacterium]|nr:leucyl/phenylalanyl-tRNA--protein transferase [Defluviitaleaceae bacterium]
MPVFRLNSSKIFPPPSLAEPDGLLAYGGDLSVERLLNAYVNGIFPWFNPDEEILWWCPRERFVIFPNEIHISRSMKKFLRESEIKIKFDEDFSQIMKGCRELREGATWISDEMEDAYGALFDAGYVLCVGVYEKNILVGGLYGVVIGKCFFGESMFSKTKNASKIALIKLCEFLSKKNFLFVDCQFHTPHLESMGGKFISWHDYRSLLRIGISFDNIASNIRGDKKK